MYGAFLSPAPCAGCAVSVSSSSLRPSGALMALLASGALALVSVSCTCFVLATGTPPPFGASAGFCFGAGVLLAAGPAGWYWAFDPATKKQQPSKHFGPRKGKQGKTKKVHGIQTCNCESSQRIVSAANTSVKVVKEGLKTRVWVPSTDQNLQSLSSLDGVASDERFCLHGPHRVHNQETPHWFRIKI